jgi:hypothetical protein
VHTDPLGTKDAVIPDNVRIYAFGGTQHGPAADPPSKGIADNLANPGDYRPFLRALLLALDAWVKDGKTPPASVYPRISENTLVHWDQKSTEFPKIPGVRYPKVIQQPIFCDYGPDFWKKGIITIEPPKVLKDYRVLVSRSDASGNDLGTLLLPDVAVPVATYTGWNLRRKDVGADGQLASLLGSYIPFAKTKAERDKSGDPRLALHERYPSFDKDYLGQYAATCQNLVRQGYILAADEADLRAKAEKRRKLFE